VSALDIETEFSQVPVDTGCNFLEAGALLRGLGEVTQKREHRYADCTGKRRSLTEYRVPKVASNMAAMERKSA
jgi:hypothetical protein